jgi:FixJ family two-component response regulator
MFFMATTSGQPVREIIFVGSKPLVYAVDDEPVIQMWIRRTVEWLGYDVACFASGDEFLAAFDPARVCCLVTDLRMPNLTGQDVLEALRQRGASVPAIVLSGYGDIPAAVRAMSSGAIEFLEKPCGMDVLAQSVRKAIALAGELHQAAFEQMEINECLATLTPDEQVALEMIASGKPDKAIATRLDVSMRTIQFRRASLMKKLHAKTRADLIKMAIRSTAHAVV